MSKRWKAPNNPTGPAKQVWAALFPNEPWPKGWRVEWAGFMRGLSGLTIYGSRRILLSYGDLSGPTTIRHRRFITHADGRREQVTSRREGAVKILVHEFVHMRCGHGLRHGREFDRLERGLLERIGLE